jgi:hypothetical protein
MNSLIRIVVVAIWAVFPAWVLASDHRESPMIQEDPKADITDLWAFLSPAGSSNLVLAMAVNPISVTQQAGTYHFSPGVRYRFNIDNDGDAKSDHVIDVRFSGYDPETATQTFTAKFPGHVVVNGEVTRGTRIKDQPNPPIINEGPNGIKVFAGPRDDPFFIDTVGFFRRVADTGRFTGTDALAGLNVSALVVELPLSMVMRSDTTLGLWAETARRSIFYYPHRDEKGEIRLVKHFGHFQQVQRAGNPVIKVLFIPDELKDLFNATLPHEDPKQFANVILNSMRNPFFHLEESEIQRLLPIFSPDTLKLDVTEPVKYPNGRTLDDDTPDLMFISTLYQPGNPVIFRPGELDGVNHNDVLHSLEFPYLAPPHQALR